MWRVGIVDLVTIRIGEYKRKRVLREKNTKKSEAGQKWWHRISLRKHRRLIRALELCRISTGRSGHFTRAFFSGRGSTAGEVATMETSAFNALHPSRVTARIPRHGQLQQRTGKFRASNAFCSCSDLSFTKKSIDFGLLDLIYFCDVKDMGDTI